MNRTTTGRRSATLALLLLSAACGGGDQGGAAGNTAGGAAPQGAAGSKAAALGGDGKLTIALIAKSSTNPVFLSARTGAEAAAKEVQQQYDVPVEISWLTPPQEDGQLQAQRLAQAVNEGADAVLLSASDAGKVTGAIDDAVARGVPVMTFDSDVPQSKRFAYYGVNDRQTGEQVMAELARVLGGKGKIAILAGNQNAPNLQARVQGVQEEAKKYPGIQVAGVFNHPETPQDAAAEVIRAGNAYPGITGWAFVGGWPLFTTALLNDLNPNEVKIVSVDALPAELAYVEKGLAPVLLAQPTYQWGYVGVKTIAAKLLANQSPPQERIPMELVKVTKENLTQWGQQLKAWGFDVPPQYLPK